MVLLKLFRSSIGLKIIMAVTGLGLAGFVLIHMLGNLQIFAGADALNSYAKLLKTSPEILWGFRLGLLVMVTIHIYAAIQLTRLNHAARPVDYENAKPVKATLASRTMAVSGMIVLAFIIFHILHFTVGSIEPKYLTLRDEHGRHDVYRMVVMGFSNPWISIGYVVSVGLLCMHLSHGVASLFQSLGFTNSYYRPLFAKGAKAFSLIIFLGMAAVPVSVLLGWVK